VTVGEDTVLVAQVGIAGSVKIGRHCILAGQAGVGQHLSIGDRAIVGPQAGVTKSVPAGQIVSGTPSIPHRLWLKVSNIISKLPEMNRQLRRLEKRTERLEKH
jgi:UDP-3-O-[3-hydroxymyristoyl] glucosamine N-acyltransferase